MYAIIYYCFNSIFIDFIELIFSCATVTSRIQYVQAVSRHDLTARTCRGHNYYFSFYNSVLRNQSNKNCDFFVH